MSAHLKSIQDVSSAIVKSREAPKVIIDLPRLKDTSHLVHSIREVSNSFLARPIQKVEQKEVPRFDHVIDSIKTISLMTLNDNSRVKFNATEGAALLNFLNKEESENFHSDFLSGFLDTKKSGVLAGAFFAELVKFAIGDQIPIPSHVVSRREITLSEILPGVRNEIASRRIDIIAHSNDYLIVIENKVNTYESTSQTTDYHEVAQQFNANLIKPKRLVEILLSPRGDTPDCNSYVPMTYHHLFLILLGLQDKVQEEGQLRFLNLYLESLFKNYFKSNQNYKDFISNFWRNYER